MDSVALTMTPSEAIAHLKKAAMTEVAIAAAVGARQSTINRIVTGKQLPNWELGQALVQLAAATEIPPTAEQGREAA